MRRKIRFGWVLSMACLFAATPVLAGIIFPRDGVKGILREKGPQGKAALVRILSRTAVPLPGQERLFWTRLRAEVIDPLQRASVGEILDLYYPGGDPQVYWTSISPRYEDTAPSRLAVIFATVNPALTANFGAQARWFTFADIFQVVENARGEKIVIGGGRAGIDKNTIWSDVKTEGVRALGELGWK